MGNSLFIPDSKRQLIQDEEIKLAALNEELKKRGLSDSQIQTITTDLETTRKKLESLRSDLSAIRNSREAFYDVQLDISITASSITAHMVSNLFY
jgi:hypothetical protein